ISILSGTGVTLRGVAGTLYLGTSGFAYGEWKGPFYPETLKDREMLAFYSSRFRSVEINYSFRRQPSEKTLVTWKEQTPEGVAFFLDLVMLLGDRLGPILFQCPPSLRFDRAFIESFVGYLPPIYRYAMEFRHSSWEEARPILAANGVAWCTAETDETSGGEPSYEPFGYLRLRKETYTDD